MGNVNFEIQLFSLLGWTPVFLVWLVGAWLCAYFAVRNPRACTLTGIALALAMGAHVILPFLSTMIFTQWRWLTGLDEIKWRVFLNTFFFSIPHAVIWSLMLWAIFGSVAPQPVRPWPEDHVGPG